MAASGSVFQNSFYIGINVENILYGVELALYFKTIHIILYDRGNRNGCRKSDAFYALFSSVMLFLITIWVATQAAFGQKMWLLNADFPGGPDAYWQKHISDWYMDWGTTAIVILQLMTDGLMIYRCRIVWCSYGVVIIPTILWSATLVLGFLMDLSSSIPESDSFTALASQFGIAYWSVSVFLNTTLTCMICYRLVRHGKWAREHLGRQYASLYFTIATIVVESVFPYTVFGIAFVVSFGMSSPTWITFISVYVLMMCISPQLLILRVIVGGAWRSDAFKPRNPRGRIDLESTQRFDSTGAREYLQALSNVYLPDGHDKV